MNGLLAGEKIKAWHGCCHGAKAFLIGPMAGFRTVPDWLVVDRDNFRGTFSCNPTSYEIAPAVNVQLIVGLYSC